MQVADSMIDDSISFESFALDVGVVGMSLDPVMLEVLVWTPPLPVVDASL